MTNRYIITWNVRGLIDCYRLLLVFINNSALYSLPRIYHFLAILQTPSIGLDQRINTGIALVWSRHGYFGSTASRQNANHGSTKLAWYPAEEQSIITNFLVIDWSSIININRYFDELVLIIIDCYRFSSNIDVIDWSGWDDIRAC